MRSSWGAGFAAAIRDGGEVRLTPPRTFFLLPPRATCVFLRVPESGKTYMANKDFTDPVRMEKIVSLCKRRGFIFQAGELYGGLNGCWDYGPLGA